MLLDVLLPPVRVLSSGGGGGGGGGGAGGEASPPKDFVNDFPHCASVCYAIG